MRRRRGKIDADQTTQTRGRVRDLTRPEQRIIAAVLASAMLAGPAGAARRPATIPACTAEGGETVTVSAVGDDAVLTLADGRIVRLAGIDPVRSPPASPALATAMVRRLTEWLVSTPAVLRPLADVADRWGRLPGLLFTAPAGPDAPSRPLAVMLVEAGLARGHPESASHACWPALLAAETAAREAGLGLWGDPYYAMHNGDDLAALDGAMGTIAIIQGRIAHVGQTRARFYIDLGPTHGAVALRVARRYSFILDQLRADHSDLVGLTVRARGVMDDAGGPHIDVTDPDQIEIVDRQAPARPSP